MKYVHIKYVFLDRGFFSVDVINALENLKIKYIMPAIKNDKIKQVLKDNSNKTSYFLKYTMRSGKKNATFNQMVKYDEIDKEYYTFATNFEIVLYNFWLLCNLIYCREHGIELGTPKITTRIMKLYIGLYLNIIKESISDPIENQNSVSCRFFMKIS